MSGTVEGRRPPKMRAETGTPSGSECFSSSEGHCSSGTVKRELG